MDRVADAARACRCKPISDNFESITLVMHKDGVMHTMPGSLRHVRGHGAVRQLRHGQVDLHRPFVEAVDDPNPAPIFERTLPSQVQLARLRVGEFNAVVEKFTFNQMNDVQIRPDVSSRTATTAPGSSSRKPEGGINPEADLVANNDFWGEFAAAQCMPFQMRVGTVAGNTVWMICPNTQYSGLTYGTATASSSTTPACGSRARWATTKPASSSAEAGASGPG